MRYALSLLAAMLLISSFCDAEQGQRQRGPSTAEERARFVSVAHKYESNPLDPAIKKDQEWAILWLIQVPDIHTKMCTDALGKAYNKEKYAHAPEMVAQMLLSSGAFVIENPEKAKDDKAQYLAGTEGVLKAYQSIIKEQPQARSKALDDLLQKQSQGELADFVRDASKKCK
jgi:carboxypeptidase Q